MLYSCLGLEFMPGKLSILKSGTGYMNTVLNCGQLFATAPLLNVAVLPLLLSRIDRA